MTKAAEAAPSAAEIFVQEPPRRVGHILLYVGPGMILAANIVGTGELIATPRLSAESGYTLLWLVLFGCIVKTFFQIEIGRYALSTGRTTLDSFNDLPGPRWGVNWLCWCWLVMAFCSLVQMGAMAGGVAQALCLAFGQQGHAGAERAYAALTGVSVVVLLLSGGYTRIERLALGMVALFTLITLYSVAQLQFSETPIRASDVAHGLSFRLPDQPGALFTALAAFGIIGVGASELVAYPYWCLEKGYGRAVGPRTEDESWLRRARGWVRVMQWDAWLAAVVFTVATIAFFLLGAALLHPRFLDDPEKIPAGGKMVEELSHMYTTSFGDAAKYVFLLGAVCVLYSTFYTATAGNARMLTDWAGLIGVYDRRNPAARRRGVLLLSVLIPVFSTGVYLLFRKPVHFVMIGGVAQALMLPLIGIAVMHFAYRRTDRRLLGGGAWFIALWVSFALMTAASVYGGYNILTD